MFVNCRHCGVKSVKCTDEKHHNRNNVEKNKLLLVYLMLPNILLFEKNMKWYLFQIVNVDSIISRLTFGSGVTDGRACYLVT